MKDIIGTILGFVAGLIISAISIFITIWIAVWIIARGISLYQSWQEPDVARTAPVVQTAPAQTAPDNYTQDSYREAARQVFMEGCGVDGDYLIGAFCGCAWTQLTNQYTLDQISRDGLTLTQDQLATKYTNIINYCTTTVYEGQGI